MKKVVCTGAMVVMSLGMFGAPVLAQSSEARRHARVERQEGIRHRLEERREALRQRLGAERVRLREHRRREGMDRNHDGFLSRRDVARYRAELRRTLRRALRWYR